MASAILRRRVYDLLVASTDLAELKFNAETILPTFTPDAPAGDRFMVLRWGTVATGIANVNRVSFTAWVYNRQPDFAPLVDALKIVRSLLPGLAGVVMAPDEAILDVRYEGDSDDLFDDGYRAYTRWTSHTITASGS